MNDDIYNEVIPVSINYSEKILVEWNKQNKQK